MIRIFALPSVAAPALAAFVSLASPLAVSSPALADQWVACAREYGVCSVPPGTRVRFGAEGRFVDQAAGGPFVCDTANFGGDPLFGVEKSCAFLARNSAVATQRPWEDRGDWDIRNSGRR